MVHFNITRTEKVYHIIIILSLYILVYNSFFVTVQPLALL